ncbi:MAG TPA: AMIN domain-containing protein [Terriglobales bacterium]|jgi:hypothetical protein|nr:AMIN domain-containing protein [Terriglobales bacterium]
MPRLFYLGAVPGLAALLFSPVPTLAQTSAPATAHVQHIVLHETGGGLEVEIQTSGAAVAPDTQAITGPDRIVVDFPGAIPAAELRALKVNRGPLKGIRAGLFFSNPPITRVVLDLSEPEAYQVSASQNAVVVRLNAVKLNSVSSNSVKLNSAKFPPANSAPKPALLPAVGTQPSGVAARAEARLQNASLAAHTSATVPTISPVSSSIASAAPPPAVSPALPVATAAQPAAVSVSFVNGLLSIHAEKATLAQVLFEVQRQTRADIAIPAGAEQEEVAADLGPAPARDVLAALLNGSHYNFIFVGNELSLDQVILTLRQSNPF